MNTSQRMGETAFGRCTTGLNKNNDMSNMSFRSALPTTLLSGTSVSSTNPLTYSSNKLLTPSMAHTGQLSVGVDRIGISVNSKGYTPRKKESEKIQLSSGRATSTTSPSGANATELLKSQLLKFFSEKKNIERFLPIINRTSPVSLRLLDYFCVNYSRCRQTVYNVSDKRYEVHSSYKNQLKSHSKKNFDPFKRNTRITIRPDNQAVETTLGQLCFFKWCLTHGVLDFVEKNISAISEDMKKNTGKLNEVGSSTERKRRSSRRQSGLTMTASRVATANNEDKITITFE